MKNHFLKLIFLLIAINTFVLAGLIDCSFAVVYVDKSANPGGNGTSWAKAYRSIEEAIYASGEGQDFWICKGIYVPQSPLKPKKDSRFFGGFSGNEYFFGQRNLNNNNTILDGQNTLSHIFYITNPNITIDGLEIRNGNANGDTFDRGAGIFAINSNLLVLNSKFNNNDASIGGAINASNTDLTVSNSVFLKNTAHRGQGRGGAIWTYGQTPVISNSTFIDNNAALMGGAVEMNYTAKGVIYGCLFENNSVGSGGGGAVSMQWADINSDQKVIIEKSIFKNNTSEKEGGAVYSNRVNLVVRTSNFDNNAAANGGALMIDYDINKTTLVERSVFRNNIAQTVGGAIQSYMRDINIENSLFTYNTSHGHGGAVGFDGGSGHGYNSTYVAIVKNSTFYGNSADGIDSYGGAIFNLGTHFLELRNSIFWSNFANKIWYTGAGSFRTDDFYSNNYYLINADFSDIETLGSGTDKRFATTLNSFSLNPSFNDPNGPDNVPGTSDDDFSLSGTSPCLDKAHGGYLPQTVCDINDLPREDILSASNSSYGNPDYGDLGAIERIIDENTPSCKGMPSDKPTIPLVTSNNGSGQGSALLPCLMLLVN